MLNFKSKVNAMSPAYIAQLDLKVQKINVNAHIIDKSLPKIYGIVIAAFQVFDKLGHFCFFYKTFLLAKIRMDMVFAMFFLTFNNADIQFANKNLAWKTYITKKALSTNR